MIPNSGHNEALAGDTLYSVSLNYEWRKIIVAAVNQHLDALAATIEDESDLEDFEVRSGALLEDFYDDAVTTADLYRARVLATNPIRYNPLEEGAGLNIVDVAGNNHTGLYIGVTWDGTLSPTGEQSPRFDGTNDYVNVFSSLWSSAFNFEEGCLLVWFKVFNSGVWTDATTRRILDINRNNDNHLIMSKTGASNQIGMLRRANTVAPLHTINGLSSVDWMSIIFSWSVAANESKSYINGVHQFTQTCGASTGSGLAAHYYGSSSVGPTNPCNGYLSNIAFWDTPVNADILALAEV